jgi:hypothetical protein
MRRDTLPDWEGKTKEPRSANHVRLLHMVHFTTIHPVELNTDLKNEPFGISEVEAFIN